MRKVRKPGLAYLIMFITSGVFLIGFIVLIILLLIKPDIYPGNPVFNMLLLGICLLLGATGTSLSLKCYIDQLKFIEQLRLENSYTLGEASSFYNLEAFKSRVRRLTKAFRNRKKKQFIIAFTTTSMEVTNNRARNKELMLLNVLLTKYITRLFETEENEFRHRDTVYAYSRGIFLIYMFTNDEDIVREFIQNMSNYIFKVVAEQKLKIWCQPFFGIKQVTDKKSLTESIEHALLARTASENNFESLTYFSEALIKESGDESDDISKALINDEFVPFFQPKYSLKEKKFISAEVLARWNSPTLGLVGPNRFIEKAEAAGLLSEIDIYIFKKAVKLLGENIKRGRRVIPISVNFSLYEFFSRNFLEMVKETLVINQVPATLVEIEITESTSQSNKFMSLSVIKKLKDMGIRVLMDDFGVGYSQINSLQEIPFDAIKIDKSFTDYIVEDEKTRSIVKLLVELGHLNDMEVIVEGAETKEQINLLKKLKVDTIQGFYYSKAISFEEYNAWLIENPFEKEEKK